MKVLLTYFFLSSLTLSAQEAENEVITWQELHPDVVAMESKDYLMLDQELKNLLGGRIVLFSDELTWSDIEKYTSTQEKNNVFVYSISDENSDVIKTWLFRNPDVKIISHSRYQSFSEVQREKFILSKTLVLKSDVLTINDIEIYENNH